MKLSEYKELKNLTYNQIAINLGHHYEVIRRWCLPEEHEFSQVPSAKNMRKIIKYTKGQVTPNDWFYLGANHKKSSNSRTNNGIKHDSDLK